MPSASSLARTLFDVLPKRSAFLYRACKRYVDGYNGDNDSDPQRNGEYLFLREQLRAGSIVFDIGANIGQWACAALAINPHIQLHCFEPSGATFQRLEAGGFPPNVKLNRLGLSSTTGELMLHVAADGSGLNSVYARRGVFIHDALPTERIPVDTVDNYCQSHEINRLDFVKIDVEGHELEVFKGMRNLLEEGAVRVIQFEYGGCNLDARVFLADIWDFFSGLQFCFYKLHRDGPRVVPRYDRRLESFQYSNWVLIRA